jgi:colanic acid biosynthesis glycosyl transferase WcaI
VKVALVGLNYPPEPTGIAVYSGGLAAGLAERGVDVQVVTGLPHYPQWHVYPGYHAGTEQDGERLSVTRVRHTVPKDPRLVNRLLMELSFGIRSALVSWGKPDVVVLISPALFGSLLAALRAAVLRRPTVVWVQDIYSLGVAETGRGGGVSGRALGLAERLLLRRAARVVAIHERFKAYLVRELGIDPARVSVVRNWSHVQTGGESDRAAARARLGWADDVTVVLHAGNMGAKQGLENVLEASRLAEHEGRKLLFVLMGDGNQRAALQAAGGNGCLQFVDPLPRDEFLDALRAADALLVNERAGLTEMAVPSKLTSYFATGLPVLAATDAGSVTAEEVLMAAAGIRVDADNPGQLVAAALQLRDDPQLAHDLGASGTAFREATLTEDAALTAFSDVLDQVRLEVTRA